MPYIGNIPVPQATQTRDRFTATSGQTTFATSGYTPNFLDVYLNGVHLDASDYTATNGSDVVLDTGAATDDIVEVVAFTAFTPSNITLASLTDVDTTGVTNGETVVYNSSTSSWEPGVAGGGYFVGENGIVGSSTTLGDIIRCHEATLDADVTVPVNTNGVAAGPLTLNGTVTVNGTLTVV